MTDQPDNLDQQIAACQQRLAEFDAAVASHRKNASHYEEKVKAEHEKIAELRQRQAELRPEPKWKIEFVIPDNGSVLFLNGFLDGGLDYDLYFIDDASPIPFACAVYCDNGWSTNGLSRHGKAVEEARRRHAARAAEANQAGEAVQPKAQAGNTVPAEWASAGKIVDGILSKFHSNASFAFNAARLNAVDAILSDRTQRTSAPVQLVMDEELAKAAKSILIVRDGMAEEAGAYDGEDLRDFLFKDRQDKWERLRNALAAKQGGGEQEKSSTYGDLPMSLQVLIFPHEWDNKNISEQRDFVIKAYKVLHSQSQQPAPQPPTFDKGKANLVERLQIIKDICVKNAEHEGAVATQKLIDELAAPPSPVAEQPKAETAEPKVLPLGLYRANNKDAKPFLRREPDDRWSRLDGVQWCEPFISPELDTLAEQNAIVPVASATPAEPKVEVGVRYKLANPENQDEAKNRYYIKHVDMLRVILPSGQDMISDLDAEDTLDGTLIRADGEVRG